MQEESLKILYEAIQQVYPGVCVDEHNMQLLLHAAKCWVGFALRLLKESRNGVEKPLVFNLWIKGGCINGKLEFREWMRNKLNGWKFCEGNSVVFDPPRDRNDECGNAVVFLPGISWANLNNGSIQKVVEAYTQLDAKLKEINAYDYAPQGGYAVSAVGGVENTAVCVDRLGIHDPMVSAVVTIDKDRWRQSDYGTDVKELSALEPGIFSWVSTVEEVARRSAICLKGVLVKPARLRIPPYQRKFAWKEQDVRLLCKDLLRPMAEGHYHLGTIILHHERIEGKDVWNVVDGQQRLTNIMAILKAPLFDLPIKQFLEKDYAMICRVLDEYSETERQRIDERLARCTLAFISVEDVVEAFQLFTTQNGRGKPLTPVNLLKAYHYKAMEADKARKSAEDFDSKLSEIEEAWEAANTALIADAPGDGKLLLHVFREYLFRLRLWSRGQFPQIPFNAGNIGEFKGVTIRKAAEGLPLQNGAVLRTGGDVTGEYVARRSAEDEMNPYVSIGQTIVNGTDFFEYAKSYVSAYKNVFAPGKNTGFSSFYYDCCNPRQQRSGASMYARHVFEALCLFCYDRFGSNGLEVCYRSLFACAYFERVSQTRVLYRRCGATYAPRAIEAMMTAYSVEDAQESLNALRAEIRAVVGASDYVKALFRKARPTRGEQLQRTACGIIMK